MSHEHYRPPAEPLVSEPKPNGDEIIETVEHQERHFGNKTLAVIGIALAAAAPTVANAIKSPVKASAKNTPQAIQAIESNAVAGVIPVQPDTTPILPESYEGPDVGIATGSWNDDGIGYHMLPKQIANEGLTEERLAWEGSIHSIRAQAKSALANGIEPVLSLPPGMSAQDAAAIAAALPSVKNFVIGNEMNSPLFSDLTPRQYVHLLAETTAAIHNVRPDALTRGFALASGYHPIPYLLSAKAIADREFGGLDKIMDGLDVHLYHSPAVNMQALASYAQIYSGPMYIGEFGWKVGEPAKTGGVSLAEQAQNEVAFLVALAQYPQVKAADMFRWKGKQTDPFDTANVSPGGKFRPSFFTLQLLLKGNVSVPPTPDTSDTESPEAIRSMSNKLLRRAMRSAETARLFSDQPKLYR